MHFQASRHLDDLLSVLCTDVDATLEEEATLNMLENINIHTKGLWTHTNALKFTQQFPQVKGGGGGERGKFPFTFTINCISECSGILL